MKTYEITMNGKSNGNVITAPFIIEVMSMNKGIGQAIIPTKGLSIGACTCNSEGIMCVNDDITALELQFPLQSMSNSDDKQLQDTFEVLLQTKYPGKWSVIS